MDDFELLERDQLKQLSRDALLDYACRAGKIGSVLSQLEQRLVQVESDLILSKNCNALLKNCNPSNATVQDGTIFKE